NLTIRLGRYVDGGFSLTVELFQIDAERTIETEDVRPDRLACRVRDANAGEAIAIFQRPVDQKLAEAIQQPSVERHWFAVENLLAPAPRNADEVMKHATLEHPRILHAHHGQREQVLVDARRRERVCGTDLTPILDDSLGRLRAVDAEASRV